MHSLSGMDAGVHGRHPMCGVCIEKCGLMLLLWQGCRAVSGETYSVEKVERGIAMALAPTSQGGPRPRTLAPMEALQRELRAQARPPAPLPYMHSAACLTCTDSKACQGRPSVRAAPCSHI